MQKLPRSARVQIPECVIVAIVLLTTSCTAVNTAPRANAAADPISQPAQAAPGSALPAAASELKIVTTTLHLADVGRTYSAVLTATGGSTPYLWSVSSGKLPSGINLNPETGQIAGTPGQGGQFAVTISVGDAAGHTTSSTFSLDVFEQPLDEYGGLESAPSPKGGTGFFRVELSGNRWTFVDPLGNDFWLLSVYHACPDVLTIKEDRSAWAAHLNERLISWGFNALGGYSSTCDSPIGTYGGSTYTSPRMPVIMLIGTAQDAMFNPKSPGSNLPEAVKDIMAGVPKPQYSGYRGPLVDVFDPKFQTAYQNEVSYWTHAYTGGFADKSWILGITTDDADNLFGFKSSGDAPIANYPNLGYLIAISRFQYTAEQNPSRSAWMDPKLYSKYAWVGFLQQKYSNNIAALNAAWGTNGFYTSFVDSGGYGAGTGVIDEDGRHTSWMGNDPFTLDGSHNSRGTACTSNCLAASAGIRADLNAFVYQFAKEYASIAVSAIRAVDKNHLIFGPAALNNYGASAPPQVLKGLSDGGIQVFQFNYNPGLGPSGNSMTGDDQSYDVVKKPAFIWYSVVANPDSSVAGRNPPYGLFDFPTQRARAAQYGNIDMPNFLSAEGSDGVHYVLGADWWQVYDDLVQNANFGLITDRDNAYDGKAAVVASGVDSWGIPTGGEKADYGDFLDTVTHANLDALRVIANR